MNGRPDAISSYGRIANAEQNPLQQLIMLYDGAINFLRQTAADIDSRDLVKKAEHVNRALDILHYLQQILDLENGGAPAQALDRLYTVLSIKVLRASAHLDARGIREAAELLVPVRKSWITVANSSEQKSQLPGPWSAASEPARLRKTMLA